MHLRNLATIAAVAISVHTSAWIAARLALGLGMLALGNASAVAAETEPAFRIQLDTITEGFEGRPYDAKTMQYMQSRAAIIPRAGRDPLVVVTMSPFKIGASDVYFELHEMRSDDFGTNWLGPFKHADTLGRRPGKTVDGRPAEEAIADFWPKWHAKSGKILGTGQSEIYLDEKNPVLDGWHDVAYSSYDAATHTWSRWEKLPAPFPDMGLGLSAGCVQRVDLPDGDILLPIYYGIKGTEGTRRGWPEFATKVLRCRFDGTTLTFVDAGNALALPVKRGLIEPSLARFKDRFFLTLRNDDASYVTASDDGLHFGPIKPWQFDDGTDLGQYNTQSHWVTHSDTLYLVYNRRGADNDHTHRHRAPLFISEVDVESLRVKRATERILIPELGASFGNFGVCDVSDKETWIVETECMRDSKSVVIPVGNRWGARGRVFAARIIWRNPNKAWDQH